MIWNWEFVKLNDQLHYFSCFQVDGLFQLALLLGESLIGEMSFLEKRRKLLFILYLNPGINTIYYLDFKYYYIEKKGSTILWLYSEVKFQQLKTCVNHVSTGVKGKCVIQLFEEEKTRILEWPNTILLDDKLPICLFFHELSIDRYYYWSK